MEILKGVPASEGIAIGRIYCYEPQTYTGAEAYFEGDPAAQIAAFCRAKEHALAELSALAGELSAQYPEQAKIFLAHQEMLQDEELTEDVLMRITSQHAAPEYAVELAISAFAAILSGVNDPLIAARVADLMDIKKRLLRNLRGNAEQTLSHFTEPVIVVTHDLLPSDTAKMDLHHVLGIVTEIGSETSHCAILARSFCIPALLGVPNALSKGKCVENGILDGIGGELVLNPDSQKIEHAQKRLQAFLSARARQDKFLNVEARTQDGVRIEVGINIGSPEEQDDFSQCDFVGLFRTEFLYMEQDHMPTEEEQYRAYSEVLRRAAGKPVTLRTLDIGGDKTLPYWDLPKEENPFLGKRALRLCLENADLFQTQLRAALRASAEGPLWIMFPMVGSLDDIRRAKESLEQAKASLRLEGIPFDEQIKTGIMIEIPSIALVADLAVQEVDFASIGTNDLCQYTMAVDRMSPGLRTYYQSLSPAMLRLLHGVISAFRAAGKPISVCGEMGGDPLAAAALVGMGIQKLSMGSASIAKVKAALFQIQLHQAEHAVEQAEAVRTEAEAREILSALLAQDA